MDGVDVSCKAEWRVTSQSSLSVSAGSSGGCWAGLVKRSHPAAVDLPFRFPAPECKASAEEKRASRAVRQEGKFIKGKREGGWLLKETGVLPF